MNPDPARLRPPPWSDEVVLMETCRSEFDRMSADLDELRLLLAQSVQEVETLNQRKVLAAARVREMEERLEHYSRQDIREAFIEANEAEMRAFMLSEQRDQWQAKVKTHERYLKVLERILHALPLVVDSAQLSTGQRWATPPPLAPTVPVQVAPSSPPPLPVPVMPQLPLVPQVEDDWSQPDELELPMTTSLPFGRQETEMLTVRPVNTNPQDAPVAMGAQHLVLPATGMLSPQMQVQSLLARVIAAQENVRQRLAQRLHDGPAQALANIMLAAEVCSKLLTSSPERARSELEQLKQMVTVTLQETRKFIFELHPMTLADLGLAATLKRYGEEVSTRYRVQVPVLVPQVEPFLPMGKRVAIFRVAQESVANAIEHSQASLIRIKIDLVPGRLVLIVEDNGLGFDVEAVTRGAHAREGLGIPSMQERADVLGGWLRIESAPGKGTRVELSIPLQP
jgi:signal transduction histidine kinase